MVFCSYSLNVLTVNSVPEFVNDFLIKTQFWTTRSILTVTGVSGLLSICH